MIKSEMIPYEEIKKHLSRQEPIAIVTCNNCARLCGVGGREKAEALEEKLTKDGYKVVSISDMLVGCNFEYYKDAKVNPNAASILILSCPVCARVVEQIYEGKKVVKCADAVGAFIFSPSKNRFKVEETFAGHEEKKGSEYTLLTGEALKDRKI